MKRILICIATLLAANISSAQKDSAFKAWEIQGTILKLQDAQVHILMREYDSLENMSDNLESLTWLLKASTNFVKATEETNMSYRPNVQKLLSSLKEKLWVSNGKYYTRVDSINYDGSFFHFSKQDYKICSTQILGSFVEYLWEDLGKGYTQIESLARQDSINYSQQQSLHLRYSRLVNEGFDYQNRREKRLIKDLMKMTDENDKVIACKNDMITEWEENVSFVSEKQLNDLQTLIDLRNSFLKDSKN